MRSNHARLSSIAAISTLLAGVGLDPAEAQNGAVKTVFENYNLVGTFAFDCSKPAGPDNYYFVHRLVDPDHAQRDRMGGAIKRDYVFLIDQALAVSPRRVAIGGRRVDGSRKGEPIIEICRVEPNRILTELQTISGAKVIADGRFNGQPVGWSNRCGVAPARAAQPRAGAPVVPPQAKGAGCRTEKFAFDVALSQGTTANVVSTGGAVCVHTVAPFHPDQVQFTGSEIVKQASNGTFEQTGAFAFKYQPRPGFRGMDEYAIRVCGHTNQRAGCAVVTFRANVR